MLNDNTSVASTRPDSAVASRGGNSVTDIDFRRGEQGEARLMVALQNENTSLEVRRERGDLIVDLPGVNLPDKLKRRLATSC